MLRFDATKLISKVQEAASEVLLVSAYDVLDVSQQFVPVDTGALKASGAVEIERGPTTRTATIGYGDDDKIDYAKYQEYGTSQMAAQPFLTPARAQAQSIVEERARQVFKSLSEK